MPDDLNWVGDKAGRRTVEIEPEVVAQSGQRVEYGSEVRAKACRIYGANMGALQLIDELLGDKVHAGPSLFSRIEEHSQSGRG